MAGTLATQIDEAPDARFSGGLAWSRDGKVLATGGGQQVLRWGMPGWKPMVPLSTWCSNDGLKACVVREVAWSPDGRALLAGARGPTRRWDAVSGAEQKGARTPAMAVAHPGDGGWLDLIDRTSEARPKALWSTLNLVASTAYQPGGGAVAVGRKDMTVSLLDGAGERVLAVLRGHAGVVSAVAWTRDGRVLISGGDDGEIRFWSADGRALAVLRVVEGTPDSYVFTEGSDARIEVFGAAAARVPLCRDGRETSPFEACAGRFSASGLLSAALRP
jgi:WD40 repeat protein